MKGLLEGGSLGAHALFPRCDVYPALVPLPRFLRDPVMKNLATGTCFLWEHFSALGERFFSA